MQKHEDVTEGCPFVKESWRDKQLMGLGRHTCSGEEDVQRQLYNRAL